MTEQDRPDGWGAVPHIDGLRGDRTPPEQPATREHSPTAYAQYHPTPRATRRRLGRRAVVGIVAGGAALLLVLVGGGVAYSVGTSAHSPTHQVDAFLGALESGDVETALADAGVEPGKRDVLLTAAAYRKATGRVTSHEVVHVDTTGDDATVDVYLRQRGRSVPTTFRLTRSGTDLGMFPVWKLDPVSLGAVDVLVQGPASTPVVVAGTRVTTGRDGAVTLRALPGTYPVSVDGGGWFTAKATTTEVTGFGGTASSPVDLTTTLTDKGEQAAEGAVNGWVDTCIASTSIEPDGCSFAAYGEDPANTYSNEKWTLDRRPVFGVGDWTSGGWTVRTTTAGAATFTADFTGPAGYGTGRAGPVDVYADGAISGFTDAGATFAPAATSSGSGPTGT